MTLSTILAREKLRDDYLSVFREVNSESIPPNLAYEGGWWCFYDGPTALTRCAQRVRAKELLAMTARLRNRL